MTQKRYQTACQAVKVVQLLLLSGAAGSTMHLVGDRLNKFAKMSTSVATLRKCISHDTQLLKAHSIKLDAIKKFFGMGIKLSRTTQIVRGHIPSAVGVGGVCCALHGGANGIR